ncbi:MAG: DUF4136 domain-containing protein [Vicinamibacterales bacterium]|jgi:hypothetical protein|nr:DUF4136 domain-containing protein [Vicinamibacterales bacterium]
MIPARLLAVAALALAAGCVSPWTVDHFEAPEADVAGRSSFAWKGGEVIAPLAEEPGVPADIESRVRAIVTEELVRKGYVESPDPARADMLLSFQIAGTRHTVLADERRVGAPSPNQVLTPGGMPQPAASELPRVQTIREGTVIIFADDPASGRLVWRGSVAAEGRTSSTEGTLRQISDITRQIVQQFPARRGAP